MAGKVELSFGVAGWVWRRKERQGFLRNGAAGEAGQVSERHVSERHVLVSNGTAGGSGSVVERRVAELQGSAGEARICGARLAMERLCSPC